MAAYAAVISLQKTIKGVLYSSTISFNPLSAEIIRPAEKKLQFLLEILERLDDTRKSKSREKINASDGRIKEVVWRFEDLLESHLTDQILPQLETHQYLLRRRRKARYRRQLRRKLDRRSFERDEHAMLFSIDLQGLKDDVDSFTRMVECMEEEYIFELQNLPEEEEEEEERIGFCGMKTKMVGLSDQFQTVKNFLMERHCMNHLYGLFGMAGIGKTTLAEEIFGDRLIRSHFDRCVWVNVGRKSRTDEYYTRAILAQVDPNKGEGDGRDVVECLRESLEGKRCLVVLDDVWEAEELDLLMSLLNKKRGMTQILLTARDRTVIQGINGAIDNHYEVVRFMNEEESTGLLCEKVFGEEGILPSRLEEAAKKIAKKCEGLPLLIIAVADRLSEGDMTEEYWNEVAEERNSVFKDALEEISKVLFPSYNYLPQCYKMLFLYLGVFPPDFEITPSKLANMLTSEGWFLDIYERKYLEPMALVCLEDMCVSRYLVLFNKKSRYWFLNDGNYMFKTYRLHCSWRHLCQVEARKNKFFHVLNLLVDSSEERINGQCCLCLHNNILFGIEDGIKGSSSTHSILCFGPYHPYPVPIDTGFKLLRELDALKLRFYTFPTEILKLVQLKYLALTCNGEIPTTISKLIKLQVLIVHPHSNIKIRGAPSYVPIQIWDLRKLAHIEIIGRSLRAPHHVASLKSLTTLLGVNASISTILELFKKFRDVNKLGIHIELTPYDDTNLLDCFQFISRLQALEVFKCTIVNPEFNGGFVAPPTPISFKFSFTLKKLHLGGMGFPWEYMDAIGWLPYLEVLKLRCYAFRGPKWDTKGQRFSELLFLFIEDTDLVQWILRPGSFQKLSYLSLKHCYKLQELHWPSPSSSSHKKLELVDCNPLAVTRAKQLQLLEGCELNLTVTSSYGGHNKNLKLARQGN